MCDLELERAAVWRETPRRARREHRCDGCCCVIRPGDAYLSHFSIFDGEAHGEAMCFPCWFAREAFAELHGAHMNPDYLWESIQDCIAENGDDDPDGWRGLLASIKRRYRRSPTRLRLLHEGRA